MRRYPIKALELVQRYSRNYWKATSVTDYSLRLREYPTVNSARSEWGALRLKTCVLIRFNLISLTRTSRILLTALWSCVLLVVMSRLPVGLICLVTQYESWPQEIALKLMVVWSESKKFIIPDETGVRTQTNQDNRGNKRCIFRNGQIFESIFKSLTWPTCVNLEVRSVPSDCGCWCPFIHSCSWRCLQTFRVIQAQGMCISIPSQTSHVRPLVTRELEPFQTQQWLCLRRCTDISPSDYGFCLKGMYASHVCRYVDEGTIALKVGIWALQYGYVSGKRYAGVEIGILRGLKLALNRF